VSVVVAPTSFTVEPGDVATVSVTMTVDPRELGTPPIDPVTPKSQFDTPRHYLHEAAGHVHFDDGGSDDGGEAQSLSVPYYASVRAGSDRRAGAAFTCPVPADPAEPNPAAATRWHLPILGPSAHPEPVVTAFELGYHDTKIGDGPGDDGDRADLMVAGVTTNLVSAASFDQSSLFFAVGVAGPWTSPALGPLPAVGIDIDIDDDDVPDYRINPEPYEADEPFGDVLIAMTYDLVEGGRVPTRRFVNIATAAEAPTNPYHNSVLVLPVFAKDIGLTEDAATFRYRAYTTSLLAFVVADDSDWIEYDAARPKVDLTVGAPTKGRPLYSADQPVLLTLIDQQPPPRLLLLHHSNVAASRFEIVDVAAAEEEKASIRFELPDDAAPGELSIATVTVTNDSSHAIRRATLTGAVHDARVEVMAPERAVAGCELDPLTGAFDCEIERLEPGGQAVLSLQLFADGPTAVTLDAELTSDIGCVTSSDGSMPVSEQATELAGLQADGGCGCRLAAASERRGGGWAWLLALAGTLFARRRRLAA
jgi:hypothetical protein